MMRRTLNATNSVMLGDCVGLMRGLDAGSVDFILTDPPYLVNYRGRSGRSVRNDDNDRWLQPAFAEMYRVLKDESFCSASTAGTKPISSSPPGAQRAYDLWDTLSFAKHTPHPFASCAISMSKRIFSPKAMPHRPPIRSRMLFSLLAKPAAPDSEAGAGVGAAHSRILQTGRNRPGPILRIGINPRRRPHCGPPLHRHRA